jgi:hypothetical protein
MIPILTLIPVFSTCAAVFSRGLSEESKIVLGALLTSSFLGYVAYQAEQNQGSVMRIPRKEYERVLTSVMGGDHADEAREEGKEGGEEKESQFGERAAKLLRHFPDDEDSPFEYWKGAGRKKHQRGDKIHRSRVRAARATGITDPHMAQQRPSLEAAFRREGGGRLPAAVNRRKMDSLAHLISAAEERGRSRVR